MPDAWDSFDGSSMIFVNGQCYGQASQFSLVRAYPHASSCRNTETGRLTHAGQDEVEVMTARVNLEEVRTFRAAVQSRSRQAAKSAEVPRVRLDHFDLTVRDPAYELLPSLPIQPHIPTPEEVRLPPSLPAKLGSAEVACRRSRSGHLHGCGTTCAARGSAASSSPSAAAQTYAILSFSCTSGADPELCLSAGCSRRRWRRWWE